MVNDSSAQGDGRPSGLLSRVPLRDQAVDVVRDLIAEGVLPPGARINEAELATKLGISRGPLREAIQRLSAGGYIEFRQNRGAFVRAVSLEEVRQMYEVREAIEAKAAALAATRASEADINRLRSMLEESNAILRHDAGGSYPSDLDLHQLVLQLAANPYLSRVGVDLHNHIRLARLASGRSPTRARKALVEHERIISAIAAGDSRAAAQAMSAHLRASLDHLTRAQPGAESETHRTIRELADER